jgi:DUF1680 family protein
MIQFNVNMKKLLFTLIFSVSALCIMGRTLGNANGYPYSQVPFTEVNVLPQSFWGLRLDAVRRVTVPLAFSKCKSERRYKNFDMAAYTLRHPNHAGLDSVSWDVDKFMGFPFDDTDVYKTIEGASYLLQTYPDKKLKAYIDSVLDIVDAAQEPDGYLYTARTINPKHPHRWAGSRRWQREEESSHELYNLGHMVDAACAHYQATGSRKFLDIARRYADCVVREVGPNQDQANVVPGHQIAEMALCRLYLVTGDKKYLSEAKYLLDYRGKTKARKAYSQSDKPILQQREAVGHAVRAGYMYAGIADVAALTQDSDYIHTIDAIFDNIVSKKYYLTGGVGAKHKGEAFGDNYELPNKKAYNETCAAISMVYLFERMFLLHGDAKYIDCLERTLYNGVISGMSMDGGRFFYPNPLASDGKYAFNSDHTTTRQPWFGCACCPSNLCRFIPSMPGYIYGVKDNDIYINLFAANTMSVKVRGKKVSLQQSTEYPWDGDIAITVLDNKAKYLRLLVRIPGWASGDVVPSNLYSFADNVKTGYSISVNGRSLDGSRLTVVNGYAVIGSVVLGRQLRKGDVIRLHLDMPARFVKANPNVKDDEGCLAVERGPLVYCAETADNESVNVLEATLTGKERLIIKPQYTIQNTEAGDGSSFNVAAITVSNGLTLIPYYAWNHRGATAMNVWFHNDGGYLFVYFNGGDNGQQIYYALSRDGLDFTPANGGKPVITADTISTSGGVRDPHIMKSKDGWFLMVATDMDMGKGKYSNHGIVMLKSKDLIHWQHSTVDFHTRYAGKTFAKADAVWAPQTLWDGKTGKYLVYFSLHSPKDGPFPKDAIYYAYANNDFTDLEGDPKPLFTFPTPAIDTDIVQDDNGVYHLFFNTWGGKEGLGRRQYTFRDIHDQNSWVLLPGKMQPDDIRSEGSCAYQLDDGTWILQYDCFKNGYSQFCKSSDMKTFELIKTTDPKSNFNPRHGYVIRIGEKDWTNIQQLRK